MDKQIQHLIDELLEIDPTLGQREEFSRMVEMMVRVRPEVRLRPDFQQELRGEILANIPVKKTISFGWFSWKNLSYFSTGLAFAAFAIFAYRQVDFFSEYKKEILPQPTMMRAPALGGAVNRMMPQTNLKGTSGESDSYTEDSMAAVKNMSPKESSTIETLEQESRTEAKVISPKSENPPSPQTFTRLSTPETALPENTSGAPQSLQMTPPSVSSPEAQGFSTDNSTADMASPPLGASAKIAVAAVRFSFGGNLPDIDPVQSVTIASSGGVTSQDFPTKSLEVIRDEIAKGGYYKDDFAFDGTVRNLEKPRIENVTVIKNGEKYTLSAIVLDVIDASKEGPKTVTVILAEGF